MSRGKTTKTKQQKGIDTMNITMSFEDAAQAEALRTFYEQRRTFKDAKRDLIMGLLTAHADGTVTDALALRYPAHRDCNRNHFELLNKAPFIKLADFTAMTGIPYQAVLRTLKEEANFPDMDSRAWENINCFNKRSTFYYGEDTCGGVSEYSLFVHLDIEERVVGYFHPVDENGVEKPEGIPKTRPQRVWSFLVVKEGVKLQGEV